MCQVDADGGGPAPAERVRGERGEEQRQHVVQVREPHRDLDPHRDEGQTGHQQPLLQPSVVGAGAQVVPGRGTADQHQHHQAEPGHGRLGQQLPDVVGEGREQPGRGQADRSDLELRVVGVERQPAAWLLVEEQLLALAQVVPGHPAAGLDHEEPEHRPGDQQYMVSADRQTRDPAGGRFVVTGALPGLAVRTATSSPPPVPGAVPIGRSSYVTCGDGKVQTGCGPGDVRAPARPRHRNGPPSARRDRAPGPHQ